ncbi:MAG: hypothetical protein FWE04_01425 [Oscillospiraceae bacterium]|nr:hypothetical protein [Oscillospiraceae bacterium]
MFKKLMAGVLAVMMVASFVVLVGCGGNGEEPNNGNGNEVVNNQPPANNVASALVGTWVWEDAEAYEYIFNADGTGTRGMPGMMDTFTWSTPGSGRLNIDVDGVPVTEEWNYSIGGVELTIDSRQVPGLAFTYIRAD